MSTEELQIIRKLEKEVEYWKNLANQYKKDCESLQDELEEFQGESKELEKELETQLEQIERKNNDLTSYNQKLSMENETYRSRVQVLQLESCEQVDRLETELAKVKGERDELHRYIRDLEQTNDDLERAKRAALVSLEDFERRLNDAIERNAFLESELDEKDALQTYVQRLKEETRDLRQELKVKDRLSTSGHEKTPRPLSLTLSGGMANGSVPKSSDQNQESTTTGITNTAESRRISTPEVNYNSLSRTSSKELSTPGQHGGGSAAAFTASTRISALNIVSDLLRKVGALESKLANSRRFSLEHSCPETPTTPTRVPITANFFKSPPNNKERIS